MEQQINDTSVALNKINGRRESSQFWPNFKSYINFIFSNFLIKYMYQTTTERKEHKHYHDRYFDWNEWNHRKWKTETSIAFTRPEPSLIEVFSQCLRQSENGWQDPPTKGSIKKQRFSHRCVKTTMSWYVRNGLDVKKRKEIIFCSLVKDRVLCGMRRLYWNILIWLRIHIKRIS